MAQGLFTFQSDGRFRRCWRWDVVLEAIKGLDRVRGSVKLRGIATRETACFGSSRSWGPADPFIKWMATIAYLQTPIVTGHFEMPF